MVEGNGWEYIDATLWEHRFVHTPSRSEIALTMTRRETDIGQVILCRFARSTGAKFWLIVNTALFQERVRRLRADARRYVASRSEPV